MNRILQKKYLFLKWFFVIIIVESTILISILNDELLLIKILVNYLFLIALIPFIFEKIKKGNIDIFSPIAIFTFFYLLLFGIRALDLIVFRKEIILQDQKFYSLAIFYAIVGLHFFQIGYYLIKVKNVKLKENSYQISEKRLKILVILYSLVSLISLFVIVEISGGIVSYVSNIHAAMIKLTTGSAFLFMSVLLIKISVILFFYYTFTKIRYKKIFLIYFLVAIIVLIIIGERGHFLSLIMSTLLIYHYARKNIKIRHLIFFIFVLLILFIRIGEYREISKGNINKIKFSKGVELIYQKFVNDLDQLIRVKDIIKNISEKIDFQYGKTFANLFFKPIPSRFWSEKPQGAGLIVTKALYQRHYSAHVTVAPSIIGELYLNFHVIGIIGGMLFFGFLANFLYRFLLLNIDNGLAIVFYGFFAPYILSELRGDFAVVTSFMIFLSVFFLFSLHFIFEKSKKTSNFGF